MSDPHWNEIETALAALECDLSPAGLHGQLSALCCRVQDPPADFGLDSSIADAAAWQRLRALHEAVDQELAEADLSFKPLLPADDERLRQRLEGLAEWAECFAFGLSLQGGFDPKKLSPEGLECLQHLLEISRLDPDDDEANGPEAEEAYTELVEFLRIAVMTLYVELRTLDASPKPAIH